MLVPAPWFEGGLVGKSYALFRREGAVSGSRPRVGQGPAHYNPGFELSWVASGWLEFELPGGRIGAATGACVLLPPDVLNTPRACAPLIQQVLLAPELLEEAADALGSSGSVPGAARAFASDSRQSAVAGALARVPRTVVDAEDPELEALVHALCLGLVRCGSSLSEVRREPAIVRALDCMQAHYGDALSVDDLARAAGLSRFVFLRKFKAQVGESPYRYLSGLRLERAALLLRTSRHSVLEVALECGFGDPGRFARDFARRFGCTPRVFRSRSAQ